MKRQTSNNPIITSQVGRKEIVVRGSREYFSPSGDHLHDRKLAAYDTWYAEYFAGTPRAPVLGAPFATCRAHAPVTINEVPVQVIALNSALFCQGDDDHTKLWVGRRCLEDAVKDLSDAVRIAMIHHPIDWLNYDETDVIQALLQDNADFILRGHLHQVRAVVESDPNSNVVQMAAGATYQGRKYPNQILYVTLDVEASTMRVRPLCFIDRPRPKWDLDVSLYSGTDGNEGVFRNIGFKTVR